MKLLLDTCTFLWAIKGASDLSKNAKTLFSDPDNDVCLSVVSIWEMLVKQKLGRLALPSPTEQYVIEQRKLHRIETLVLEEDAVAQLSRLPDYHKDPFDRMLICQAITHGLTILTPDKDITQYPVPTIW